MALPAILGMGWLATKIGAFVAPFFLYTTWRYVKSIAGLVTALGIIIAATLALSGALRELLNGIIYLSPATSAIYLILPSNFSDFIGVFIAVRFLKWGYGWNVKVIGMLTRALN